MLIQYPNILIIPGDPGGDAVKNDAGDLLPSSPAAPTQQICRYEPSSQGKQFPTADGNFILSKGVVFMPAEAPFIPLGTMVEVPGYFKSPVLESYKGELHCKLTV